MLQPRTLRLLCSHLLFEGRRGCDEDLVVMLSAMMVGRQPAAKQPEWGALCKRSHQADTGSAHASMQCFHLQDNLYTKGLRAKRT